jgi:hypothetical protein
VNPQRIQLSRQRGWRKPEGAVVVSRPSRWGNPFRIVSTLACSDTPFEVHYHDSWLGDYDDALSAREAATLMFAAALRDGALLYAPDVVRQELAGRSLACWCAIGDPCHADVLLDVAAGGAA